MNCKELVHHLHEYLDGELPPDRAARFDQHLSSCAACQRFLQSYRKTIQLFKKTWDIDLPHESGQKLWRSLERKLHH